MTLPLLGKSPILYSTRIQEFQEESGQVQGLTVNQLDHSLIAMKRLLLWIFTIMAW
jgi:hypothetical protein